MIAFLVPFIPYICWKCLPVLVPFKRNCSLLKYGSHIVFHALLQHMQNRLSLPHEARERSSDCYTSPILNLLQTIPLPLWAPVSSSVELPGQTLMLCTFEGVWGPWRMGPWNQVGTPEWRHQLWAGSSWCLRPVSHPPRCLEKKQRCVTNQRNGDKYSPCWINIPRITHVSFKVKQRSCATWQPPIWPEKSRHMDGAR